MFGNKLLIEAKTYEKNLLNFFWRLGVPLTDAEDLVQETFLRLWKYRSKYKKTAKLSTFLFIIARQVHLDALRKETRRKHREDIYKTEQELIRNTSTSTNDEEKNRAMKVRFAVSQLSKPLREVVELGVFQELPYADISKILDIPIGTVKSRMSNAIKKLSKFLKD